MSFIINRRGGFVIQLIDITGNRYGRLVVLGRAPNKGRRTMWHCLCDCGNTVTVRGENLKSGNTKSCGCIEREHPNHTKHGMSNKRISYVFNTMKGRCYNPNNPEYHLYGGRGITICDEWLNDCSKFYKWAYENGYDENAKKFSLSIDRIDVNKGYSPDNCRWADAYTQANNTRKNVYYELNGEKHTLAEFARMFNIKYSTLYSRVVQRNKDLAESISSLTN